MNSVMTYRIGKTIGMVIIMLIGTAVAYALHALALAIVPNAPDWAVWLLALVFSGAIAAYIKGIIVIADVWLKSDMTILLERYSESLRKR